MVAMPRYVRLLLGGLIIASVYARAQEASLEDQEDQTSQNQDMVNEDQPLDDSTAAQADVPAQASDDLPVDDGASEQGDESLIDPANLVQDDKDTPVETPQWVEPQKKNEPVVAQPAPEQPVVPAEEDEEVAGIDTVDLEAPQGNWLYKRVWWERAESKYEKIRSTVTKVFEMRTAFFAKRSELDEKTLDPFYLAIGIGQGELQQMLSDMIETLKQRELAEVDPKEDEKIEIDIEQITKERTALEDLKKEIDGVAQLDHSVDDAIMKLVEQINRMRSYEQQAWQNFKDIARVLDDKKARELYYKVDGAWRNVQEIQQYLQDQYAAGFDQIVEQVKKDVGRVGNTLELLKEQGINLKARIAQITGVELPQEEPDQEEEPGVVARFIVNPIKAIFNAIGSFFSTIWDFITWPFSKGEAVSEEQEDDQDEQQESVEPVAPIVPSAPLSAQSPAAQALGAASMTMKTFPTIPSREPQDSASQSDTDTSLAPAGDASDEDSEQSNTLSLGEDDSADSDEPEIDALVPVTELESNE